MLVLQLIIKYRQNEDIKSPKSNVSIPPSCLLFSLFISWVLEVLVSDKHLNFCRLTGDKKGDTKDESIDTVLQYHQNLQENIADEMIKMAQNLKHTSVMASNIIKEDNKVGSFLIGSIKLWHFYFWSRVPLYSHVYTVKCHSHNKNFFGWQAETVMIKKHCSS